MDAVAVATGAERSGVGARLELGTPERGLVGLTGERVIILQKDKGWRATQQMYKDVTWNLVSVLSRFAR